MASTASEETDFDMTSRIQCPEASGRRPYARDTIHSMNVHAWFALVQLLGISSEAAETAFRRGDTNSDGAVDLSDGVGTLGFLFLGSSPPACRDAADADDNGVLELTDAVFTFGFLFSGGSAIPA